MPLSFDSANQGAVAFGFFNVDVDLLLLDTALFYADEFATAVDRVAAPDGETALDGPLVGYRAGDARALGNTMGAIHGFDRGGLIGAVYDLFPFPDRPEDFRQHPDGARNRGAVGPLLEAWTSPISHRWVVDPGARTVEIAGVTFAWPWFRELVAYVWRGGYPRWRDGRRPGYLVPMKRAVEGSTHPLFDGQGWDLRLIDTRG